MRRTLGRGCIPAIWPVFRHTSRRLVQRPMPATAGIASAMAISAAAVCAPQQAHAFTVLATITGTVTSGKDVTGVFVGKDANLAGYPYTATFTLDTTQGINSPVTQTQCYNGLHSSVIEGASRHGSRAGCSNPRPCQWETEGSNPVPSTGESVAKPDCGSSPENLPLRC
jgi:hypothetical protein